VVQHNPIINRCTYDGQYELIHAHFGHLGHNSLSMDMGFVQGTKFTISDTDGKEVTILDRFNSYLLIMH